MILRSPDSIFLPTSSDHVVDSDNIFIVGVAVVILHTHLCISCRCMLNKTKDQLNSVWFMLFSRGYYNAEIIFKHFLYRETVKLKLGGIALKRFQRHRNTSYKLEILSLLSNFVSISRVVNYM